MDKDSRREPDASGRELVSLDDSEIDVTVAPKDPRSLTNAVADSSWKASSQNQQNYQNN
jgi:hypothetical protein